MSSSAAISPQARLRSANLLGALAADIAGRLERHGRVHPNETSSANAALNVIGLYEGCSNGALGQALGLSHAAAVRLVDKLEAAGLVRRDPTADRRAVALRLTDVGRGRAQELMRDRCALLSGMIDALTPVQRRQLDGIAEALLRASVSAAKDAWFICRLCDTIACPPEDCPVHLRAMALDGAEPPP